MPVQNRKLTQRQRLLDGMVVVTNRDGAGNATIAAVTKESGISRPSFYEHFRSVRELFIAAVVDVHERLLEQVRASIEQGPPEQALARAVSATFAFVGSEPAGARFLMKETLAGGPDGLDARDAGLARSAEAIEASLEQAPAGSSIPDLPVAAVLGAIHRLLAARLRRGERIHPGLERDLLAWIGRYAVPAGARRWRALTPLAAPPRSPYLPPTALRAPVPLPQGRTRLSEDEIIERQRQVIMFAVAQLVQERGYAAVTVPDIIRAAHVGYPGFHRLFADKQDAFSAVHELGFQYLMATAAGAYFAGSSWPERIWEALRAMTQSIDDTPAFAHVAFVEAYAVGPRGIQRVEDSHIAFAIFLQEGYRAQGEGEEPPSQLALEAIVNTAFEIVYLQTRAEAKPRTAGMLAQLVQVCLTPFVGTTTANALIDAKLAT
jgi:AcrR family transcriptional regulator